MQMKNIIIKTALAIIAAVLTTGCIFEKMDMPKDLQNVMILLNVSADDMQTKATLTDMESKINSLHIYAFCNGKPAGYMLRQVTEQNTPFLMDLLLPAIVQGGTAEENTHDVQFYLVANAESMLNENVPISLDENTTQVELDALTFTGIVQNSPLPLYCKHTEAINVANYTSTDAAGHEGHYCLAQEVTFSLTRSLAKISVYGAKPAGLSTSPRILSVEMLAKGTRQYSYVFEQTESVINAVPSRANNLVLLSTPVSVGELSDSADKPASYTEVMTDPTYISEVAVGSDSWNVDSGHDNAVVLKIDYVLNDGGQTKTANVYMPPILRNHHYKVLCLFSGEDEGQIIINLSVADWEGDHEWTLDYAYPTYQSPVLKTGDHGNTGGAATMYYAQDAGGNPIEEGAFSVDFQMTAPSGQTWMPTFFGDNADYKIKVYDGTTEVATPVATSDKWYTIKIIPLKSDKVGSLVQFGITYNPTWLTNPEFLLINSGTVWNTAGSNEDLIVVTQVEKNI